MASTGYTDYGEELAQKNQWRQDTLGTRDTTAEALLYDDSTDSLSDSSDIGDVTTEPSDGNYTRQTLNLDGSDLSLSQSGGDLRVTGTVTFDVTNTTGSIDAWGIVLSFQSDIVNSEGSQNPHLISTATLGSTRDLTNYSSLDIEVRLDLT